jgi:hypothetical protein
MKNEWLVLTGALSIGCYSAVEDAAPAAGELRAPAEGDGIQLEHSVNVPAGSEQVLCRRFVVPADRNVEVAGFEHQYAPGAHHVILYREPGADPGSVSDESFECGEIAGPLLYSSQLVNDARRYPTGVGFPTQAGDVLRLELHVVNSESVARDVGVRLNLWYSQAEVATEAGTFFFYDRDILLPPHEPTTVRMRCEVPKDIQIPFLAPHTHRLGTAFRAKIGDRLVLDSGGYGDLTTVDFDPPLSVRAGEFIEFECDYVNDSAMPVVEGPSRDQNEMCLLLGGYYPRLDFAAENCTLEGSGPIKTGSKSCGQALACSSSATDGVADETCFVDVCPASQRAFNDVTNCGYNECNRECFTGSADCQPCVLAHCAGLTQACFDAGC